MNRPHTDERNSIASRALALLTAAVVLTGVVCADLSYVFAADPALTEMAEEAAIAETAEEETFTAETVEEAVIEFVEAEEATTESVKAEEAIEEPSEDAEAELPQESAETLEEMESIPAETVETIETIETVEAVEAVEDELSAYAQDILSKYDGKVVPLNEACSILDEIEEDAARNMQFSFYEGDPVDAAEKENGIVLKGELPEAVTAQAAEVEVSLDTEAGGVLYAYDITLSDGDEEYEPDQAVEVTLNGELIAQANEDGRDLLVIHIADDGTETIVEDVFAEEDRVVFAADGFSVYAVAEAPAPVEIEAQAAEDLTALTSEESLEGFYLSVTKGTNTAYYFQNTLNASGAFELTDNAAAAAVWFLEPVEEGLFLLSTEVGGEARFVTNPKANNAGLSADPAEGALFIISEAASELFWVKLADADKWLQYSGSGKGIRFYTDKNNAGNSRIAFTYASSLEMPKDPYGLDGQAWILLQYGNGTGDAALLAAEKNASALESQSLQVRVNPQNRSESLYVAKDSDASIWTFGAMGGDLYTLCADGLYLEVEGTSLTITTDAT
ncbi:MAG: hypothetical protein K5981_00735 [Clostridia bacterium]|nr:hypothetical protein [Clostridia bacterium]